MTAVLTAMTEEETAGLQELAQGRTVLELGAYLGHSTIALAEVAESVWSVDWHQGDIDAGERDTLALYLANLDWFGMRERVTIVVGRFEEVLPHLAPGSFGLIFLDGCHEADDVERDLRLIVPLLGPRTVLALHDWGRFGVCEGCRRVGMHPHRLAGTLAVFEN